MENKELSIGDYVTLKVENSPELLVLRIIYRDGFDEPLYDCGWFTKAGRFQHYKFERSLIDRTKDGKISGVLFPTAKS